MLLSFSCKFSKHQMLYGSLHSSSLSHSTQHGLSESLDSLSGRQGGSVRTNRQQAHGNLEECIIWKHQTGTQHRSRHSKVVERDKNCASAPVLCFMPAKGYDYFPSAHIVINKLHMLCSAAYRSPIPYSLPGY